MKNFYAGGGLLAAGLLTVVGVLAISGPGTTPTAQAQVACPENTNCIIVIKEADPSNSTQDFDFGSSDGAFSLGSGESKTLEFDENGTYSVSEEDTVGWSLTDIDCSGGSQDGVTVNESVATGTVTVTFDLEEDDFATVTCTFYNEMDDTPTPTPTATGTATATPTGTTTATPSVTSTATSTPVAPTATPPPATVRPPNTGSAGLK